jgi:hypothetical protein
LDRSRDVSKTYRS